ncbi:MAG: nucleoside triphosphate pyrophosphohydrolase [Nanoarchaeota archaeon]|nr:nucleoside triphosphate pyrophosphohydrolase [Nanoarchaeota archaeon]
MKYNKLVRDKIPDIIKKDNHNPVIHIASDEEYWEKLKEKLKEETNEFIKKDSEEEFADILEVLYAISDFKHFDKDKVNKIRENKAKKRGRFKDKIILEKVD